MMRAIRAVRGVTAVANDIEVRLPGSAPADPQIARAAVAALELELLRRHRRAAWL